MGFSHCSTPGGQIIIYPKKYQDNKKMIATYVDLTNMEIR